MSNPSQTDKSAQSTPHPSDILKDNSLLSQQSIYAGQFIVRNEIEPADELESPPLNYHFLAVLLEGGTRQVHRFAGSEYEGQLQSGHFSLLPADVSAFWSWESENKLINFILDPQLLRRIALECDSLNPDRIELKPILKDHDSKLLNLSLSFLHEMQTNGLGGRRYSECLANQFVIHLLRHYCAFVPVFRTYNGGLSHPALVQAIDYIHEHLDEKLTVEAIASHLNLSVYYFCTLFTQSMGISPYQYVLQQRVERVKYLLKTSPLSLSEIAVSCGFNDQTQMSKHFRKLTGMTPKAYRKGD
jgi:AraC family transcriptional regulator